MIARPAAGLVDRHFNQAPLCATFVGGRNRARESYGRAAGAWYAVRSTDRTLTMVISSLHVNFIGTDGQVHELYARPGHSWVDNDLTALA